MRKDLYFLILLKFKEKPRVFTEKNISDGKEMSDNINGTINETDFTSIEDALNMHRTVSNEVTYVLDSLYD